MASPSELPDGLPASNAALFERSCAVIPGGVNSSIRAFRAVGGTPYVVASDRTLREIAVLAPRTRADLMQVHGIGPAKADRYGAGLLQVVERARTP